MKWESYQIRHEHKTKIQRISFISEVLTNHDLTKLPVSFELVSIKRMFTFTVFESGACLLDLKISTSSSREKDRIKAMDVAAKSW